MAKRVGERVRLFTRNGNVWSELFPAVVRAVEQLDIGSCLIDGEIVVCDEQGLAVFDLLRHGSRVKQQAHLFAFDLLELDGRGLIRVPIEERKYQLARLLNQASAGVQFCSHLEGPGDMVFEHACKLGCEGIVSKRWLALPAWPRQVFGLDQGEEPGGAGSEARGGRGLGQAGMKKNTGARWEVTVDGRPRTYDQALAGAGRTEQQPIASSCRTSQCSAGTPSATRTTSAGSLTPVTSSALASDVSGTRQLHFAASRPPWRLDHPEPRSHRRLRWRRRSCCPRRWEFLPPEASLRGGPACAARCPLAQPGLRTPWSVA